MNRTRVFFALAGCAALAATIAAAPAPQAAGVIFEQSPRAVLAATGNAHSTAPSLFFSASGHVYLLAAVPKSGKVGLEVFTSDDGGDTFSKPIEVTPPSDIMTHGEMSPRFVRDPMQRTIYTLWEGTVDGHDALRVAHAGMFGHTFSAPVAVSDATTPAFDGFATLGAAPNGDVYAAWLDGREGQKANDTADTYIARSTDHGATFGTNIRVARDACPCCRPSLAFGADGTVYLAWRQDFPGNYRDIVVATSHDHGATWSDPVRVNRDGWSIQGCPDSGPTLSVYHGVLQVAWYTLGSQGRAQVRYASSSDGKHFTPAVTISANVDDANHPKFVEGPVPYPLVVFEGRDAGGAGFGRTHAFLAALRNGSWSSPQSVPSTADGMIDPVATMRDPSTIYVTGTAAASSGMSVELVRGRLAE